MTTRKHKRKLETFPCKHLRWILDVLEKARDTEYPPERFMISPPDVRAAIAELEHYLPESAARSLDEGYIARPPGCKSFYVYFRDGAGKRRVEKVGAKATAQKVLKERIAHAEAVRHGIIQEAPPNAELAELWRRFRAVLADEVAPNTLAQWTRNVEGFFTITGAKLVSDLGEKCVSAFKATRRKTAGPGTVNVELRRLRAVLEFAEEESLIRRNPFKNKTGKVPRWYYASTKGALRRKRRALTLDEMHALLHRLPKLNRWALPLWKFYLATGCRKMELVALLWRDFDAAAGVVRLRAEVTKTRTARDLHVGRRIVKMLQAMRKRDGFTGDDDPIFLSKWRLPMRANAGPLHVLRSHLNVVGVLPKDKGGKIVAQNARGVVDVHSLRVSFRTLLEEIPRASSAIADVLLGHGGRTLAESVYVDTSPARLAEVAQALEDVILTPPVRKSAKKLSRNASVRPIVAS